jgi:hypothetical protein
MIGVGVDAAGDEQFSAQSGTGGARASGEAPLSRMKSRHADIERRNVRNCRRI